jgi:hypothetical protein
MGQKNRVAEVPGRRRPGFHAGHERCLAENGMHRASAARTCDLENHEGHSRMVRVEFGYLIVSKDFFKNVWLPLSIQDIDPFTGIISHKQKGA